MITNIIENICRIAGYFWLLFAMSLFVFQWYTAATAAAAISLTLLHIQWFEMDE